MPRFAKRKARTRKQPIAVVIIAFLLVGEVALRLYWVAQTAVRLNFLEKGIPWPWWNNNSLSPTGIEMGLATFRFLWAMIGIVVLFGLLRMKRWSWIWLMIWLGFSLTVGILHYFYRQTWAFSASNYAFLAADMILAFALNQADVQRIYGIRRDNVAAVR